MITYTATNTVNGKFYIGSTDTDFERRKRQHLRCTRNYPFQNALRADPQAFEWEVFEDDSNERILEQALLDMFFGTEQCYNLTGNASAPMNGRKHTEETIQLLREMKKGKGCGEANPMFGKTGERNPFFGQKHTDDVRKIISEKVGGENAPALGKKWWINSKGETKFQKECPGEDWQLGRGDLGLRGRSISEERKDHLREIKTGTKHWVNEQGEHRQQQECPGEGWQNGRKWKW
jgi:group I intron endonuclease